MIVCVPVAGDQVGSSWGRAERVAVARVVGGQIEAWEEFEVGWYGLHDEGTEGSHHARIARFLKDHNVECVVAGHMGPPMERMLGQMGIQVRLEAAGDARSVVSSIGG